MQLQPWQKHNVDLDILFSINALRRAWQQVRRNGKSSGTDGVSLDSFELNLDKELDRLRQDILEGVYKPLPIRRYYIKKLSGKQRPISIWAIRDRVAQRVVSDYMITVLEEMFFDCSYGFRPGLGVDDALKAVIQARDLGFRWVLDADIKDCFGSIEPELLIGQTRRVIPIECVTNLIRVWLYTPVEKKHHEIAGLSQGGVISPILANLYLHRFDEMMVASLAESRLIRFADDFVVLSRTEEDAVWSMEVARRSLENLRLSFNVRKTQVTTFADGFHFLGVTFHHNRVERKV